MYWKLWFSITPSLNKKENILFKRVRQVGETQTLINDPKYKMLTRDGTKQITIKHWIPRNFVDVEWDGNVLPNYNYCYACAFGDDDSFLMEEYGFFVTSYEMVSANVMRFYLEEDVFQNYFASGAKTTYVRQLRGTCIQTNDPSFYSDSNVEKQQIVKPKTWGRGLVYRPFRPSDNQYMVLCVKTQEGVKAFIMADFVNDNTKITALTAKSAALAQIDLVKAARAANATRYKWDGTKYTQDSELANIQPITAYILPIYLFRDGYPTADRQYYYKFGDFSFITFDFLDVDTTTLTLDLTTVFSGDLKYNNCTFGTNMHRIEFNPLMTPLTCDISIMISNGLLKIQLEFCGQTIQIEDDFEIPFVDSDAARQYAQQEIFRNINALKGGLSIATGIIGATAKGGIGGGIEATVGAIPAAIDIAASYIPPQAPLDVKGNPDGALNCGICGGLGVFYSEKTNKTEIKAVETRFGYNINNYKPLINSDIENVTENESAKWYKYTNAQLTGYPLPEEKRLAIEQMFNDGIFIERIVSYT